MGMQLSWLSVGPAMLLRQVRFPSAARDFSPGINFLCRLSHGVHKPSCAIAFINICKHVRDPKHWQTKILHALLGMDSAALVAAVALPR